MTPAQEARTAALRAAVHAHCPELIPVIKDLHQHGLIDGWRNVESVLVEGPPRPLNAVNAAVYLENSKPIQRGPK